VCEDVAPGLTSYHIIQKDFYIVHKSYVLHLWLIFCPFGFDIAGQYLILLHEKVWTFRNIIYRRRKYEI